MSNTPIVDAQTIDEVLDRLNGIIDRTAATGSRLGYFAALYRGVTTQVKAGIVAGRFQDGPRMERLDVRFANRYLRAYDQFQRGEIPSRCWQIAFATAATRRPLILQHLLLGMNAHINLDLGVAAAETVPGSGIESLRADFDRINDILAALVPQTVREIGALSPWIGLLNHVDPKAERAVINFSMVKARDQAWELATRLAPTQPDSWPPVLAAVDGMASLIGQLIAHPLGLILNTGLRLIRLRETSDVARVIQHLARIGQPRS